MGGIVLISVELVAVEVSVVSTIKQVIVVRK